MKDASTDLYDSVQSLISLFETWRDSIFANLGVTWIEEPPSIIDAREAIKHFDLLRCTDDGRTCPVGHDHP